MSLDCYPFGERRVISLEDQPIALDVAYDDNLFISVTDQCQSIVVYDLLAPDQDNLIRKFSLNDGIVVDQVKYCPIGDYLACVGHKNGLLSIYIVLNWRQAGQNLEIFELDVNVDSEDQDKRDKLNSIDCCQKTGNLAASLGDKVVIYKYLNESNFVVTHRDDANNNLTEQQINNKSLMEVSESRADDIESNINHLGDETNGLKVKKQRFEHIISVRLTIWALKISLLENYLSITAVDHVQVLKLELLTLQIQSDVLDSELANQQQQQDVYNEQTNNSGSDPSYYNGVQSETTSTSTTMGTTCSMISDSNSTNATDVSSSNNNSGEQQLNNSDLSIITMNQKNQNDFDPELDGDDPNQSSADDCITWNLNTKKLVKLPTLMHNTSKNLSSYHICHPLELLGPASESIACRVSGSIYSIDFSQNQLEPVVMLCKQFDFERDPVKSTYLKAIYLSSYEDKRRLAGSKSSSSQQHPGEHDNTKALSSNGNGGSSTKELPPTLMESAHYELLASVTCFVTTLTTCFVYTIHGEEVARTQTITYPDLCLDLRPDLLNAYLLTPMGLQICSTGVCDSTFRYEWSSSADLNLSFIATNRTRVLTTANFVLLVGCSLNEQCEIEFMEKLSLKSLYERIVHTVNRCNSISIRSNLLTYLHAMSQLDLLDPRREEDRGSQNGSSVSILKTATIMLCKQLLQKKQTNVITNNRIDKNIKHLLDVSFCDLDELMKRQEEERSAFQSSASLHSLDNSCDLDGPQSFRQMLRLSRGLSEPLVGATTFGAGNGDNQSLGSSSNYELIKIYLKQSKFNQSILNYLISNLTDETISKTIIGYMFEHNPRLLIKCAQRIPMRLDTTCEGQLNEKQAQAVTLIVDKLRLLAEFFSTGIDRATVLFTLASLYNSLNEKKNCLNALSQIKPLNHLVITMSHHYELSQTMANIVQEYYPDVFNLFTELVKRKKRTNHTLVDNCD